MTDLYSKLPAEEIDTLYTYLRYNNGGETVIHRDHMDYFLREWDNQKQDLYKIFGNQFILEKEVEFNQGGEEFIKEMNRAVWGYGTVSKQLLENFRDKLWRHAYDKGNISIRDYENLCSLIFAENLILNEYPSATVKIPGEITKSGKTLVIQKGCKAVKAIKKIVDELGIEGDFEEFRRVHSMVLNQKKLKGTICLSIHPMDYITISDNDYNWSSCMAWVEEPGDYRIGTLEMMNSPCVVVAYLKGSEPGWYIDGKWNNKKWRQLIIVTPDLILGNKQYPYENDELQGFCMKWLKNLCEKANYGVYYDELHQIHNCNNNYINGERKVKFNLYTNLMYNDVYDERAAFVGLEIGEPGHRGNRGYYDCENPYYELNFSGLAVCTGCGCYIDDDNTTSTSAVCCVDCDGAWICSKCGDRYDNYSSPAYTDDAGNHYCSYCVECDLETCEVCGEDTFYAETLPIVLRPVDGENHNFFNYSMSITICPDCCASDKFKELYGGVAHILSPYGVLRDAIYLENITDEGLENGNLSSDEIECLKQIRVTIDLEERKRIWDYYHRY